MEYEKATAICRSNFLSWLGADPAGQASVAWGNGVLKSYAASRLICPIVPLNAFPLRGCVGFLLR